MKSLIGLHARAEHDERLGVLPGHDEVVRPHAVADVVAAEGGGGGQALGRAAVGGHGVDLGVAVVLAGEGELRAVGREAREGVVARAAGQAARGAAVLVDGVELPGVVEDDLRAVGRREAQQAGGVREFRFLREHRERQDDRKCQDGNRP